MARFSRVTVLAGISAAASLLLMGPAAAQDAGTGVPPETQFIFNTLSFLMSGFLVMWMAAGFAMLEAGLVRKRSVGTQLLKNISVYSVAGILFYLIGYNLMYDGVDGGFFGGFGIWSADDSAALAEQGADFSAGYAAASDWFFQMVFVATAASIVSGTLAERLRVWPFVLFSAALSGILYPITGSWQWGGGWLSELGFSDFAGSTLVHSVGGWAALAGALLLGARKGKFGPGGQVYPMLGSSLPLATLGTFILWLGWFGFNGGSQLALGSAADAIAIANIYVNTNLAAAGGLVTAMAMTQIIYKKIDLSMVLNGAIAGLVSITAEPLAPSPGLAILIGAVGGVLVVLAVPLLYKLRDRRRGRRYPGPPGLSGSGAPSRSRSQSRCQLRHAADRHRRDRGLHVRGQSDRLVDPQGHDRHPHRRRGRGGRDRPGGARHGGVPGVRTEPRALTPYHPVVPGCPGGHSLPGIWVVSRSEIRRR